MRLTSLDAYEAYGFGDREHQNSRPTLVLLSAVLETLVSILARACEYSDPCFHPRPLLPLTCFSDIFLLVHTRYNLWPIQPRSVDVALLVLLAALSTSSYTLGP